MQDLLLNIKKLLELSFQTVGSFLKVVLMSRYNGKFPSASRPDLLILGNGPSLKKFLHEKQTFLKDKDLLAVNHFVNTDQYQQLKPSLYLINVPEFWKEDIEADYKEKRIQVFKDFAQKTKWEIHLFLDFGAKKAEFWKEIIKDNPFIKVHFFNTTPVEGFKPFTFFCYKHQCGMPRPHNVLIPSLMMGINMGYKNIYVAGADHNWMNDLFVAEDNTVYLTQKHFYDEHAAQPGVMKKEGKGKRKMHEILIKFVHAFKGYWDINTYAKKQGVNIINITPGSMIDAFKRMNL